MTVKYLSAAFECWNCTNPASTYDSGKFKYLAVEQDDTGQFHNGLRITGEMHAICETCFEKGDMEIASGPVKVMLQSPWGLIEIE